MKIRIGYGDNLGLPSDFAKAINCEIEAYHDLNEMLKAFAEQNLFGIFISAGTLPYLSQYELIAQALFGQENKLTLQSNLVTTATVSLPELRNFIFGRVNQYCTTSYWAPLIYLMDVLPRNTSLKFQDTNGFQDMLIKTAEDKLDCSMVWDIILQQNPQAASKVHVLFSKNDLPTPVIVGREGFPLEIIQKIRQFKTQDPQAFFTGFQAPNMNSLNHFKLEIQKAILFYNLRIKQRSVVAQT